MVTTNLLEEFKKRMHIFHEGEDDNLKQLLSFSIAFVESKVGEFNIESDERFDRQAKELVFERTRYAYNDALEYFEDNFLSEILSLSLESAISEDELNIDELNIDELDENDYLKYVAGDEDVEE